MKNFLNGKFRLMMGILCASFLMFGCDAGYEEWDTDDDNFIDENEFETAFTETNYYEGWDEDDDDLLDENELYEGTFEALDTDNDNYLDEDEWTTMNEYFTDAGYDFDDDLDAWDDDDDDLVDVNEYTDNIDETGVFDDWDADDDNFVDEDELTTGIYDTWDMDDDNLIDEEQFGVWDENRGLY